MRKTKQPRTVIKTHKVGNCNKTIVINKATKWQWSEAIIRSTINKSSLSAPTFTKNRNNSKYSFRKESISTPPSLTTNVFLKITANLILPQFSIAMLQPRRHSSRRTWTGTKKRNHKIKIRNESIIRIYWSKASTFIKAVIRKVHRMFSKCKGGVGFSTYLQKWVFPLRKSIERRLIIKKIWKSTNKVAITMTN